MERIRLNKSYNLKKYHIHQKSCTHSPPNKHKSAIKMQINLINGKTRNKIVTCIQLTEQWGTKKTNPTTDTTRTNNKEQYIPPEYHILVCASIRGIFLNRIPLSTNPLENIFPENVWVENHTGWYVWRIVRQWNQCSITTWMYVCIVWVLRDS